MLAWCVLLINQTLIEHWQTLNVTHYVPSHQCKRKLLLYDLRAHNIDRLRYRFGTYPWEILYDYCSIEQMYDDFVYIVLRIVAKCIPTKVSK